MAAVSKRAVIYEDTAAGWAGRLDSVLATIGDLVDTEIYPRDSANFADPLLTDSLTDHDSRIAIVFSEQINRAGYSGTISPCDQFSPGTPESTNFGEFLYSAYLPASFPNAAADVLQEQPMVIAHEMKHLALLEWRLVNNAPFELSWLDEGMAEHAEELWARDFVYKVPWKGNTGYQASMFCDLHLTDSRCRRFKGLSEEVYQLYHFLDSRSASSPVGTTRGMDATAYNSSWSLIRWAIDRYAPDEGAALRALVQSHQVGMSNLTTVLGHPADEIFGYWSLAMILDGTPATANNRDLDFPTWDLYDILSNLRSDGTATNPALAFFFGSTSIAPAVQAETGDFALPHAGLWGGGFLPLRIVTPTGAPRIVLGLRGAAGGTAAPMELRIAIARLH